MLKGLKVIVD